MPDSVGEMSMDEALEHFGTKGMKWGQRKADRPSSADITAARQNHNSKIQRGRTLITSTSPHASLATKKKVVAELQSIAKDARSNKDFDVAFTSTKGEKVAAAILAGPFGPMILRADMKNQKDVANAVLDLYEKAKPKDLD
jgi:hypothetical protein